MCGGIGYKIKNIPEAELAKFYTPEEIARFKQTGAVEDFFWRRQPVLPIKTDQGIRLKVWGNKDKNLKLPATGWAREESIMDGKWDYLKPEEVLIGAEKGYEKKVWFDLPQGTPGLLVKRNGEERVYMITKPAGKTYQEKTGHDRQPIGKIAPS